MPSADFRISNQMLVTNSLANLQSNLRRLTDLQDEASSLKRLRKPSDAPADVVTAMRLHSDLNRNDQISRNIDDAGAWLGTADDALTSAVTQLQRVHDLIIQARNSATDSNARAAIAGEIDTIRANLIGVANTKYAGRAIFGGTATGGVAYQADGTYVGVSAAVERTIGPGQRVQVNVNGDAVFGPQGSDLFTTLSQISDAVKNDPAQLDGLSTTFDAATTRLQNQLADVGARFRRVDSMKTQNSADALTMKKNLSAVEDADLAEVMMNLQSQQVAYQAALEATSKSILPSLADFLR
ncbi:MAG TPA: flagellar hook-associated protein FlgL [Acidimicrobiia bacterium]|nr:flagellar hook-associated protein FlgL [Acidimicrobiia bacterium]